MEAKLHIIAKVAKFLSKRLPLRAEFITQRAQFVKMTCFDIVGTMFFS